MHKQHKPIPPKQRSSAPDLLETLQDAPKLPTHEWRQVFGDRRHRVLQTAHFKRWQLQEAKARFSAVFDRALTEGPPR